MNMKLTEKQVIEIRKKLKEGHTSVKLAKVYQVAPNTISDIKLRRTWKEVDIPDGEL